MTDDWRGRRDAMDHPGRPEGDHERGTAAPLRVSSILASSIRIWLRDLRSLLVLTTALEAPLVIVEIVLQITPGLRTLVDENLTGALLVVLLYGSLSHHFLSGLLERVVASERFGHRRPTLGETVHQLPWYRLVVADLLLTALVAAGFVAFVVPGLIVLTWFSVALPIVNLERDTVLASFVRSYRLVRGHSWRVFVIATSAFLVPELLIAAIAGLVHHFTSHAAVNAIGHAIPAIILMPVAALPLVVLAFDLVDLDAERHTAHPT